MSIVTWTPPSYGDPNGKDDTDRIVTAMAHASPKCVFCGTHIGAGQKAWVWHGMNDDHITAHAGCLASHASGILGDIATVLRK